MGRMRVAKEGWCTLTGSREEYLGFVKPARIETSCVQHDGIQSHAPLAGFAKVW
jgi:hypothetical protein